MVKIYHTTCGRAAFLYEHLPVAGEILLAERARTLNGGKIKAGSRPVCGACGFELETKHLAPNPMSVYDMTSDRDMSKLYGEYKHHEDQLYGND